MICNRDLKTYLLSMKIPDIKVSLGFDELLSYCQQIASGMTYLSDMLCVHRDLAARNIFLSKDKVCKVSLLVL